MNHISEYEARLRDQEWDKAEDRRLERKAAAELDEFPVSIKPGPVTAYGPMGSDDDGSDSQSNPGGNAK